MNTMFVHDIETFSVLHDCWLTILSHPFDFLTTRCTFLSSIQISTFFYRRCVVFAVGGDPILRVQKYHDIETVVTLGHNGLWLKDDDSLAGICNANVTLLELFASKILYFALRPNGTSSLSLKICV